MIICITLIKMNLLKRIVIMLSVLAAGCVAASSEETFSQTQETVAKAERRLEKDFHGIIYASRDGKTVYEKAFGFADVERALENETTKRFRIGSVSKTFTVALVRALADEGALSLDDRISTYIKNIPNGDQITLLDLVEHRSGLQDFSQGDWRFLLLSGKTVTRSEVLALIQKKEPKRLPGVRFEYNNVGYVLLGYVISDVTKLSYDDALFKYILEPLALVNTGVAATDGQIANLSTGHTPNLKIDEAEYDYSAIMAAGGMYSTARDMAQWCASQNNAGDVTGWRRGERFGLQAAWHPGNSNDYSALLVRFPEVKGCYVVLSNVGRRKPLKEFLRVIPEALFAE